MSAKSLSFKFATSLRQKLRSVAAAGASTNCRAILPVFVRTKFLVHSGVRL